MLTRGKRAIVMAFLISLFGVLLGIQTVFAESKEQCQQRIKEEYSAKGFGRSTALDNALLSCNVSSFSSSQQSYTSPSPYSAGACSYHGGVSCESGKDVDGGVICSDGWKNSSVLYSSVLACQEYEANQHILLQNIQKMYESNKLYLCDKMKGTYIEEDNTCYFNDFTGYYRFDEGKIICAENYVLDDDSGKCLKIFELNGLKVSYVNSTRKATVSWNSIPRVNVSYEFFYSSKPVNLLSDRKSWKTIQSKKVNTNSVTTNRLGKGSYYFYVRPIIKGELSTFSSVNISIKK